MAKGLIRPKQLYGPVGRLPVGHSKFYDDFVNTGRLRWFDWAPGASPLLTPMSMPSSTTSSSNVTQRSCCWTAPLILTTVPAVPPSCAA